MKRNGMWIALVLCVAAASVACGEVTFCEENGCGFVGKGDVQSAFGWNNAELQENAECVEFSYCVFETYRITEVWATGDVCRPWTLECREITIPKWIFIAGDVCSETRKMNQVTGFCLEGYDDYWCFGGPIPEEDCIEWVCICGEWLPVDENGCLYRAWDKGVLCVEKIWSIGGLYAEYCGDRVLLPEECD